MKPPCEMVVWYVIPTIRSELAKELLKLGMKQKEISKLLDITQPAVSQYISDKRGHGIKFNEQIMAMIKEFAHDLKEETVTKQDIIPRTCKICKMIKAEDVLCQIHKEKDKIPADCTACLGSNAH
ncbi:MAG: helix-turn-helix domain-containing protein [Euryarchaeota archaeon]|nr:helix-turn-helix domain-containing protein [Euryarchaeota archaeon]MBU4547495.1 helix-turn-helix domain-containing protein [Euryarchaeota archaeon]MBU4608273.1 helix-turn-helix domain-containing protein [Euryarchaeota archaeon]MBV1729741.1 helix-turn-helix domain-containing protein [Methanobacterium sp.]MBV1755957.1 helix-turn-helix domain-containing protein [Methanobacterium sp.]